MIICSFLHSSGYREGKSKSLPNRIHAYYPGKLVLMGVVPM